MNKVAKAAEGESAGSTQRSADNDARKRVKVVKEMKKDFREGIQFGRASCLLGEWEDFEDVEFDGEELEQLIWDFVENDCDEDDVVKFLIEKGLDLGDVSCDDETPLVRAVGRGKFGAVEALLKAGANPTNNDHVFDNAACFANGSMVRLLIKYGADVNAGSEREGTILHMIASKAVAVNHMTCLTLVLEAGAKERLAVGDGIEDCFQEEMTPTQLIRKKHGGDAAKAEALKKAVDLLELYRVTEK